MRNEQKCQVILVVLLTLLTACSGGSSSKPRWQFSRRSPASTATLPDHIWLRELDRTFTERQEFVLEQGKIYVRPRTDHTVNDWNLLGGTGIPDYPFLDRYFVEIMADADDVLAVDNLGTIHHYGPTDQKFRWHKEGFGAPIAGFFQMPKEKKTWAMGRKSADVMYYEDALGQQFHWGIMGTTTLYVLSKNGQEIALGDTGLPPDVGRQICGPDRGRFIAEGISAAGATVFLISKNGEMFTKLDDYDADGGTPFYKYTYDPIPPHQIPGTSQKNEYLTRYLPLPDWKQQPTIPTGEHGRISKRISIQITGHGNSARELRVAGISPDGEKAGHYWKLIDDSTWQFTPTDIELEESDLIANNPQEKLRGPSNDRVYKGQIKLPGKSGQLPITLLDFNLHCSPVLLDVELEETHIPLLLHTVDAWHLFKQLDAEHNPRGIRLLKGTLEVPDASRNHPDPKIKEFVLKYFMPAHHKTFAISVVANRGHAQIEVKHPSVAKPFSILALSEENNKPLPPPYFMELATSADLEVPPNADRSTIAQILRKNRLVLEEIEQMRSRLNNEHHTYDMLVAALTIPRSIQQVFGTRILGTGRLSAVGNMLDQSYALIDASRKAYKSMDVLFGNSRTSYEKAKEIVQARIKLCKALLAR